MISKRTGATLLVFLAFLIASVAVFAPRVAQPLSYHQFADHRTFAGIANFLDVASNLPFGIFGFLGVWFLSSNASAKAFLDARERWPYFIFFVGFLLTAFGSGYYHLMPNNSRLVWDRLPMTIAFTSLVCAMIAERIDVTIGVRLVVPLLCVGLLSVAQWHRSELRGIGDLRFYAAIQVYSVAAVLLLLLLPPRYTRTGDLVLLSAFYLSAKVFETFDHPIYSLDHNLMSGHTLKHLAAGMSGFFLLRMLQNREPIPVKARSPHAA